jgi:hypothetical protein
VINGVSVCTACLHQIRMVHESEGDRQRNLICRPGQVYFESSKLRLTSPTSCNEAELRPGTSS